MARRAYRALLHKENAAAEARGRYDAIWMRSSGGSGAKAEISRGEGLGRRKSLAGERRVAGESQGVESIWPNWIGGWSAVVLGCKASGCLRELWRQDGWEAVPSLALGGI